MNRLGHGDPFHRMAWIVRSWSRKERAPSVTRKVRVIGHRGAPRSAAENTIDSFRTALDAGADAIETDVCVTRDGKFILWHDANPSETIAYYRQAGREKLRYEPDVPPLWSALRRPVKHLDWATFRRHYGYSRRRRGIRNLIGHADGPPEVPPATLEDLLSWAAREPRLRDVCLDVKLTSRQVPDAVKLMERIEAHVTETGDGHRPRFHYLSQSVDVLRTLCRREGKRERSIVPIVGDFEKPGVVEFADRLGLKVVSMGNGQRTWTGFREELASVVEARDRGRFHSVIVWTFNDRHQLEQLVGMSVDGIFTDDPALLRSLMPERIAPPEIEPAPAPRAAAS